MAGVVPVVPRFRFWSNGSPVANGSVTVYLAGTTTPVNTYKNKALSTLNTNPVNLDANGECVFWVSDANNYKFLLTTGPDGTGATVAGWPVDDIPGNVASSGTVTFTQSGTGAVTRTVEEKLREGWVSVADFGADNTGVDSCTTEVGNARTVQGTTRILFIPEGTYDYSSATYDVDGDFLWINKGYASAVNPMALAENTGLSVTFQTPTDAVLDGKKSRIGIGVTGWAYGAQHASGVRSNVFNSSTDGNANTAFYGHIQSDVDALGSFALHGEFRHGGGTTIGMNVECSSFTALGTMYGAVINNTGGQLNASGITHTILGTLPVLHPDPVALLITGTALLNPLGGWVGGIRFEANAMRSGGIGIDFQNTALLESYIKTEAATSTADIHLQGNSAYGLLMDGTYSGAAICIKDGQMIALEATNNIKYGWTSGNVAVEFFNGANNRVSLDLSATPGYRVATNKVVGARMTGWAVDTGTAKRTANATYSGTAEAGYTQATIQTLMNAVRDLSQTVKALKDDLHATAGHGLIGT